MFLGIDIGTSGIKLVLLDADGTIAAQEARALTVQRPHSLWSEQSPADWWGALDAAVLALDPRLRAAVRGIGLSGQMHGAVVLGADDAVLRPAILWNDGRSQPQCDELLRREPRAVAITGNPVLAGFTAPKLLWLRDHEPEVFARVRSVLLPKDWVRFKLTGEKISDMSDASGTLWLEVGARRWSAAMLAACGLDETMMPALREGTQVAGQLVPGVAARWGMARVPVAAGGGDNAAAAVGLGAVRPGDALLSLGTSGVIFVVTDGFRPDPAAGAHAFAHAVPARWHAMSVMLSAAACLDWAAALTGLAGVAELIAEAGRADPASDLLFLPYLSGERTPHADPAARGVLFGLGNGTGRAEIARAVLEGVAMGLRDGLDVLTAAGAPIGELGMAGGGSRSESWGRIIAAALDIPLVWRKGGEIGPALGAARLAQVAVTGGAVEQLCAAPDVMFRIDPDPALAEAMRARQARFRALFRAVAPLWR